MVNELDLTKDDYQILAHILEIQFLVARIAFLTGDKEVDIRASYGLEVSKIIRERSLEENKKMVSSLKKNFQDQILPFLIQDNIE